MTDRERLLELADYADARASELGKWTCELLVTNYIPLAKRKATKAWHQARTAQALRDVMRVVDSLQKTRDEMPYWGEVPPRQSSPSGALA